MKTLKPALLLLTLTFAATAHAADAGKVILDAYKTSPEYKSFLAEQPKGCVPAIKLQKVDSASNRGGDSLSVLAVATNRPCVSGNIGLDRTAAIVDADNYSNGWKAKVRPSSIGDDLNYALASGPTTSAAPKAVEAQACYHQALETYRHIAERILGQKLAEVGAVAAKEVSHGSQLAVRFTIKSRLADAPGYSTSTLELDEGCVLNGFTANTSEQPISQDSTEPKSASHSAL